MLQELLPRGRWAMLKALWLDDAVGSVQALARRARMSYSNAHAELMRLERASLAKSRVVGNALVFQAAKDLPVARALETLVRASAAARPAASAVDEEEVLAQLAALGAPVHTKSAPAATMSVEHAVAHGLPLTHRNPSLARAYPVLLARNRNRLDLEALRQRAVELKEKATLGFFLELTGILANDRHLRGAAQSLNDRRVKRVRDFFEGPRGKYERQLADERTPEVARRWRFRMNMDLDNFRDFYAKFGPP